MKTKKLLLLSLLFVAGTLSAQNYQVPVSEQDEPMSKENSNLLGSHCLIIKYRNGSEM